MPDSPRCLALLGPARSCHAITDLPSGYSYSRLSSARRIRPSSPGETAFLVVGYSLAPATLSSASTNMMPKLRHLVRVMSLAFLASHSFAKLPPEATWTSLIDSGTTVRDASRVIHRTTDGNVVLADMITALIDGTFLRVVKLNTTEGAKEWTYQHATAWSNAIRVVADAGGNALLSGIVGADIAVHNGVVLKFGPSSGTPISNVTDDSGLCPHTSKDPSDCESAETQMAFTTGLLA